MITQGRNARGLCGLLVIIAVVHVRQTRAIVDFCAQNTYMTNSSWLQLNKEASSYEYAIEHRFKGLHCCAKGYRSIEWFKDGKAYPWPGGVSNLILYPESANQTIYTQAVSSADAGNYTCRLRNDTHVRAHTIHLHVFDKVPDAPKITYKPKSQEVEVGQPIRLFCEAFVGRVDLPDAHNDASWRRPDENDTIEDEPRIRQEKVDREDGVTLGAYLVIEQVTKEDYGDYICRISKPDKAVEMLVSLYEKVTEERMDPNPVPWKKITIISAITFVVVITAVVLNMQYGLVVRVWLKDRFGPIEDGDGKLTDVLICYSQNDAEIVLGVLIPKLESKYQYKCGCREFSSNVNYWHVELAEAARKSRRVLAVLSPGALQGRWDAGCLLQSLRQLQALGRPLIVAALRPLPCAEPQLKDSRGHTLASLVRGGGFSVLPCPRTAAERFWLALRLALPPKRGLVAPLAGTGVAQAGPGAPGEGAAGINQGRDSTRLNSNSHESLEILV